MFKRLILIIFIIVSSLATYSYSSTSPIWTYVLAAEYKSKISDFSQKLQNQFALQDTANFLNSNVINPKLKFDYFSKAVCENTSYPNQCLSGAFSFEQETEGLMN